MRRRIGVAENRCPTGSILKELLIVVLIVGYTTAIVVAYVQLRDIPLLSAGVSAACFPFRQSRKLDSPARSFPCCLHFPGAIRGLSLAATIKSVATPKSPNVPSGTNARAGLLLHLLA